MIEIGIRRASSTVATEVRYIHRIGTTKTRASTTIPTQKTGPLRCWL